jgi:peptidoglycan/LPS O-acetylase OafA/YrhL
VLKETPARIPSLDGLRAISISLVVLGHLSGSHGWPTVARIEYFDLGNLGVRVFFVISGFLITGLLLKEHQQTGRIDLPAFYVRRTLRIFPAYYVFLTAMALAGTAGWVDLRPGDLLHAATYTENYHEHHGWAIGHTWSLAVEEQFYLLWPLLMFRLGPSRALRAAAGFAIAVPVLRFALRLSHPDWYPRTGYTFETTANSIAIGCLLAGWRPALQATSWYPRLMASRFFFLVPLTALAVSAMDRPRIQALLGHTAMNVAIALTIDWCVRRPSGRVGRVLNAAPLVFVGTLSYSLYLWQQPFLDRSSELPMARFPLSLALAIAAALVSYYGVERPFLGLRHRFLRLRVPPAVEDSR